MLESMAIQMSRRLVCSETLRGVSSFRDSYQAFMLMLDMKDEAMRFMLEAFKRMDARSKLILPGDPDFQEL